MLVYIVKEGRNDKVRDREGCKTKMRERTRGMQNQDKDGIEMGMTN